MSECAVCRGPLDGEDGEGWCIPCWVKTRGMTPGELADYRQWINGDGMDPANPSLPDPRNRAYDELRVRSIPKIRELLAGQTTQTRTETT